MKLNNCTLAIRVKGRPVVEYISPLNYQHYIEGRDGSEFELEFRNDNPFDVETILSIDGVSIIDGKPAGAKSSGYVVKANSTIVIPGWKVDGSTAAKFTFSGKKGETYVEKIGGEAQNKGVIGAMVFAAERKPYAFHGGFTGGLRSYGGRGISPMYSDNMLLGSSSAVGATLSCSNAVSKNAATSTSSTEAVDAYVEAALGTDFGEATQFDTVQVSFKRGDLHAVMVMYYNDAQALKRLGIDVTARHTTPSAFPADEVGCTIPDGWKR